MRDEQRLSRATPRRLPSPERAAELARRLRTALRDGTAQARHELLSQFVRRIELHADGSLTIRLQHAAEGDDDLAGNHVSGSSELCAWLPASVLSA